jgi:hypothetical protein
MADNILNNADSPSKLATDITIAWLQNPNVQPGVADVSDLLKTVLAALDPDSRGAAAPVEPIPQSETPAPKAQGKRVKGRTETKATPPKASVPASVPVGAETAPPPPAKIDDRPKAARPARADRKPKASGLALLKGSLRRRLQLAPQVPRRRCPRRQNLPPRSEGPRKQPPRQQQ